MDAILETWGKQNPWERELPNGAPNPFFDANPSNQQPAEIPKPVIPNFSRKQHSTKGEVPFDENTATTDPNPKRHGSIPVAIPPRTLHVA